MGEIDFEGTQQNINGNPDAENKPTENPANVEDTTDLNGSGTPDITGKDNAQAEPTSNNSENEPLHDLAEGTEVEFDGTVYKIDADGNLVDEKGNIFKEAKDIKSFIEEHGGTDAESNGELSIDAIQDAIGIEIIDEQGNALAFTNDAEGVKNYIDSVLRIKSNELQQGAINKLFMDSPMLKDFINYVKVTGSPKGFGDIPDRSGITLDRDNKEQLKAVIRIAASEFGNASLNDNYIKYLESTGSLYEEANAQLQALVAKDKEVRRAIEEEANAAYIEEQQNLQNYWNSVKDTISSRRIGNYLLPETIVKDVNGRKVTYKLSDFYDYLAKPTVIDEDGNQTTPYNRDLANRTDKDVLERDLLDAWLLWTGGSYGDLVDMAIKEETARRLVLKSKENRARHNVKISKPNKGSSEAKLLFE